MRDLTYATILALTTVTQAAQPTLDKTIEIIQRAVPERIEVFAASIAKVPCPALPSKDHPTLQDERLQRITEAVLKKITAIEVKWSDPDKEAPIRSINALVKMRNWALSAPCYGNILIASTCEFDAAELLTAGLTKSQLSADQVKSVLADIDRVQIPFADMVASMMSEVPQSVKMVALMEMVKRKETTDMDRTLREVCEEQKRMLFQSPEQRLKKTNVGGVLFLHLSASANSVALRALAEYVSTGGLLSLERNLLKVELEKRIPDLLKEKLPWTDQVLTSMALTFMVDDASKKP